MPDKWTEPEDPLSWNYHQWARRMFKRFGPIFRHHHEITVKDPDLPGHHLKLEKIECEGECYDKKGDRL